MSAGGARRGRRDNGLDATSYAVVGDVDPRVGEHLLDVLAAGGIAAYLQPSADLNPITRTTTFPARPTDRLFVDRTHLAVARDYVSRLAGDIGPASGPTPRQGGADQPRDGHPPTPDGAGNGPDVEAEWARIVAGFHLEADPTTPPWPPAEGVDPTREPDPPGIDPARRRAVSGQPDPVPGDATEPVDSDARRLPSAADFSGISLNRRRTDEPSLLDGLDTFGTGLPDDADERYTPPPPPPLPRISKYAALGVLALLGGAILFLFPALLPIDRDMAVLVGFTAIVSGFVTLIWRLRPGDEEDDDDPDDGAVV